MKLLVVVDMQNDFLHPDGALYGGQVCRDIIPFVKESILAYRNSNDMVILSADTHEENDKQFRLWSPHCIYKSWGWELIDEIKDVAVGCTIIKKPKFSAFYKTDLDSLMDVEDTEVEVVGVFTSMCVSHTIADLYNRDAVIIVPRAGIADSDPEAQAQSLKYFEKIYRVNLI